MEVEEIVRVAIKIFYKVYTRLGSGFLEKVYENAMKVEFEKAGILYKSQFPIKVYYENVIVGEYIADFILGGEIILELKAKSTITDLDKAQLLNYMKATKNDRGLLLNYGNKPEIRRFIF